MFVFLCSQTKNKEANYIGSSLSWQQLNIHTKIFHYFVLQQLLFRVRPLLRISFQKSFSFICYISCRLEIQFTTFNNVHDILSYALKQIFQQRAADDFYLCSDNMIPVSRNVDNLYTYIILIYKIWFNS